MFCRHCGAELQDGARFCPNCCAPIDYDYQTGGMSRGTYISSQGTSFTPLGGTSLSIYSSTTRKHRGCLLPFVVVFIIIAVFGMVNALMLDSISESNAIVCEIGADSQYIPNEYSATVTFGDGSHSEGYKIPAGIYKVRGTAGCSILGEYDLEGVVKWAEVGWIVTDGEYLQSAWVDLYDFVSGNVSYHWGDKSTTLTIEFPFDVFVTQLSGGQLIFIPQ